MAKAPDPYPPTTAEEAVRFLRERPSIDGITMAMEDRLAVFPDPNDRVYQILRDGLNPLS